MISLKKTSEELLKELNLMDLSEAEQKQVLDQIEEHFGNVVLDTMLEFMSKDQFEQFKEAIKSKDMEIQVATVAAQIPDLAAALDVRINEEYKILKAAMLNP